MQPYLDQFPHIRYVKYENFVGNSNNYTYLYELSTGEFINYLMDDDLFHPEKIEKMMHFYIKDSELEIRMVTSHRQEINENGKHLLNPPRYKEIIFRGYNS